MFLVLCFLGPITLGTEKKNPKTCDNNNKTCVFSFQFFASHNARQRKKKKLKTYVFGFQFLGSHNDRPNRATFCIEKNCLCVFFFRRVRGNFFSCTQNSKYRTHTNLQFPILIAISKIANSITTKARMEASESALDAQRHLLQMGKFGMMQK